MDSDSGPAPGGNVAEYSVGEISQAVKRTLEGAFERVRVRGEVSRPNYHSSGHLYLVLKDADAVLDGVCWRGTVARLGMRLEEGMEVVVTGRISSYPRSSRYQIVIEAVELAGEGALLKLLEDRRKKLAAEGLFAEERKKPIPFLPQIIGVVTSPTGAVIRDILHRLADRFPRHVLLWPVPVQGEGAAEKIAAAIEGFNALQPDGPVPRPDLLIVARGGGSLEDLWAFNEEVVVRAAAASDIPLISAVGHETDTTLIDYASDRRAPTPTAAAEMAVPVRAELAAQILDDERRLVAAMARQLENCRTRLLAEARGLPDPVRLLEESEQDLDAATERLANGMRVLLNDRASKVSQLGAELRHPREILAMGEHRLVQFGERLDIRVRAVVAQSRDRFDRLGAAERLGRATQRMLTDGERRLRGLGDMLESLSYQRVLERGYVVVRDARGDPVTSALATAPGMALSLKFADGEVGATVNRGAPDAPARRRGTKPPPDDEPQGSLL